MKKKAAIILVILVVIGGIIAIMYAMRLQSTSVLHPQGVIASKERDLMVFGSFLALIVVVPVFALLFGILWRYRATNTKAKYSPDFDHSRLIEGLWWGIPSLLIVILSIVTWQSSHSLDPFRPLSASKPPLTVQVIALDWKWLFIYPDQHIATVNTLTIPVNTPVQFSITADAPMNSFWIPQLGGQIYAMPGMSTQLHLEATNTGKYAGSSANISGAGFSGMRFIAHVVTDGQFSQWVTGAQQSSQGLSAMSYDQFAQPSQNVSPSEYRLLDEGLYDRVISKYMMPGMSNQSMGDMNK